MCIGNTKTTMNVHLLSHLAQCVEDWGSLWAYICFPFESMNKELKFLFHGSRDMCQQVRTYNKAFFIVCMCANQYVAFI